jgi:hypothetical protein
VDCTLPGSSFAWRKSVLTGSVERQHRGASFCGGVSSLDQRGKRALHFSGESNKGRGRTKSWAHISLDLVARLVRSLLCIQVPLYCITCCISCFDHHYIDIYPKLIFSGGGFIQGHVDQKYLCQIYACL